MNYHLYCKPAFVILGPPSIHHPFFWYNTLTSFENSGLPISFQRGICDVELAIPNTAFPSLGYSFSREHNVQPRKRESVPSLVGGSLSFPLTGTFKEVSEVGHHLAASGGKPWSSHGTEAWRDPLGIYKQPRPKVKFTPRASQTTEPAILMPDRVSGTCRKWNPNWYAHIHFVII